MQIEHKTEKGTLTFFLPPSRADRFKYFDDEKPYLSYFIGSETFREYFLKGTVLIGLTSEVTEEQVKMMVDETLIFTKHKVKSYQFKSYIDGFMGFDTALDSFKSLMQHLNVYEVNPIYPPIERLQYGGGYAMRQSEIDAYEQAQSRTGKWIVLFKPND